MGFDVDELFNKAAVVEFKKAAQQLVSEKKIQQVLKKSFGRYDSLISKSIEESPIKPACKSGCSYCCYYKVEVRAHEMFLIKDHMETSWSESAIKNVLADAAVNATLIKTLTHEQHLVTNIKCPFLLENTCSIYPVRPFKCRNFHSTDVDACEESFNRPSNLSIQSGYVESVALFGNAHSQGFEGAVKNSGMDLTAYDLNTALLEVFEAPTAFKRFNRGKKAFLQAIVVDEE